ncbi:MAG: fibrobacter succinogenes major paralogous domain-containing protein [Fibrobacter intestinalis]|uniref:fibrobacter succinogenes major paralogous domain-containing protein n=1 Tax=Fibrobacter intestinalis TaxID=28122 RepID=UPI003F0F3266
MMQKFQTKEEIKNEKPHTTIHRSRRRFRLRRKWLKRHVHRPRDGQTYKTVQIGNQTWMAENLNYETDDSYCYDEPANCRKYGRLYTWDLAPCPSGWHLPSKVEWDTLFTAVGGEDVAGLKLKSTSGWYNDGNGTDEYGFSVLPAGYRNGDGDYLSADKDATFWSSTEYRSYIAYSWNFCSDDETVSSGFLFVASGTPVCEV